LPAAPCAPGRILTFPWIADGAMRSGRGAWAMEDLRRLEGGVEVGGWTCWTGGGAGKFSGTWFSVGVSLVRFL